MWISWFSWISWISIINRTGADWHTLTLRYRYWHSMYRKWLYRKKHVPKVYVPKLSCTESDIPRPLSDSPSASARPLAVRGRREAFISMEGTSRSLSLLLQWLKHKSAPMFVVITCDCLWDWVYVTVSIYELWTPLVVVGSYTCVRRC